MINNAENKGKDNIHVSDSPTLSPTPAFVHEDAWQVYIDNVTDSISAMKKAADDMPTFQLLSQSENELLIGAKGPDVSSPSFVDISIIGDECVKSCSHVDEINKKRDGCVRSPMSWLRTSSNSHNVNNDGLGSTYNCGIQNVPVTLVSKFMRQNVTLLSYMPSFRKHVVDYCMVDHNETLAQSQIIASFGENHFVTREDFLSLATNEMITTTVIEGWSLLMNYVESTEDSSPRRIFFGLNHVGPLINITEKHDEIEDVALLSELFSSWDIWISCNKVKCDLHNVDLIFVPLLYMEHYFIVVINFIQKRVDYLDNRVYGNWDDSHFKKLAISIRYNMSDYLDRFEHPLAADLVSYDIINVKFPWQTSKPTLDCGVFAMVHMLNYDGEIFESQLDNAKIRRTMRAEICAALVLCDINNIRKEIIQKIHEFNEIKASIRDKLWMIYKEQDNIRKETARLKV